MFETVEDDGPTTMLRKKAHKRAALKRWRSRHSILSTVSGPNQLC